MFQRTTAVNKLLALKKRKRVIQGGTWAGKTYGILPCLINKAISESNKIITVVAESIPAIKEGALSNFTAIMHDTNRWRDDCYNGTDKMYRFYNKSSIQFTSFDSVSKAKAAGKRTDLFINEGNYISFEIADALMMRTSENIWIDFNPVSEFWAHREILPQVDCDFLLLKYSDNECLPKSIYDELMMKLEKAKTSSYWRNWCKVYIDGEIGSLEGLVFPDIKICDEFPKDCKWIVYGLDFGFTNDPSALIKIGMHNGWLYMEEIFYRTGLTNQDIGYLLKQNGIQSEQIVADSADPKSIEEIRRMGFNIVGAVKGKDSIKTGIDLLQRYTKHITSSSISTIEEFRNYKWKVDKATGKAINVPEDFYNHSMDAIRYAVWYKLNNSAGATDWAIL